MTKRRRTPLGTQPPPNSPVARGSLRAITSEPAAEVSGTIENSTQFELVEQDAKLEAHKKAVEAALAVAERGPDPAEETSVIVQIDDDWLARLDLPPE